MQQYLHVLTAFTEMLYRRARQQECADARHPDEC